MQKEKILKQQLYQCGKDKLNISSVNNGKDYIYDETAVKLFGWIWDTVKYDDVTLPENLLTKGQNYLSSVINESMTIELSAVDLHHLYCDIEKFHKGDLVRVISIPHKLDRYFQVSKLSLSLDNPKESKLTLGQTFSTLTQNQLKENKAIQKSITISNADNVKVTKDIESLKENFKKLDDTLVEIPSEYVKTNTFESYKTEVNQKIASVYTVRGSVADFEALQSLQSKNIGDVYNLLSTGANYVYTEDGWDKLSETIDLSAYLKTEDAKLIFVSLENFQALVERVEELENKNNENIEGGTT